MGAYRKTGEGLFAKACNNRTRGNGRFRLDIRKQFFTMQEVEHWNKLLVGSGGPLPRDIPGSGSMGLIRRNLI